MFTFAETKKLYKKYMAIIKDEVLQKVNDYCTEKQYTLDESFRDKFSEKFAAANNGDSLSIDDEGIGDSIRFNLDTAFSAASKGIEKESAKWKKKEGEYKEKMANLEKPAPNKKAKEESSETPEIPKEIQDELTALKEFREGQQKQDKRSRILAIAKKSVREDLHRDLEKVFDYMAVDYAKEDGEIAKTLSERFMDLFKDKIGDIRPKSPESSSKKYEELTKGMQKVKI